MQKEVDLDKYSRKSPYLKTNIAKYAPQHEIPREFIQNNIPLQSKRLSLVYNNSNNITVQNNFDKEFVCYICYEKKDAFNKCSNCNKLICSDCLRTCEGCEKLYCKFDRKDQHEYGNTASWCFSCVRDN